MINIVRTNLVRADQRGKSTKVYQQKEVAPEDFQSAQVEGGNMVTMVMQALDKYYTYIVLTCTILYLAHNLVWNVIRSANC